MITERLNALGNFNVPLNGEAPEEVLDAVSPFASIVVTNQHLNLNDGWSDAQILDAAIYSGMIRRTPRGDNKTIEGNGNAAWWGDEQQRGHILIDYTPGTQTFVGWFTGLCGTIDSVTAPLTAGTLTAVSAPAAGNLTDTVTLINRRQVADMVADYYSGEYRINHDFTVDAGAQSDLYVTTPTAVIVRRGSGDDPNYPSIHIDQATVTKDVADYLTDIYAIGKGVTGAATTSTTYDDPQGNDVHREAILQVDTNNPDTADTIAASVLIEQGLRTAINLSTTEYDSEGAFTVGDTIYVYDPESGLLDAGTQIQFRGQVIFPTTIRVVGVTWPVTRGMGVYVRSGAGVYTDVTEYVVFESGSTTIEVGASPRSSSLSGGAVSTHQHPQYEPSWQTWPPTYSNLTVGSGTVVARYTQIGKTVKLDFTFTFGAGSAVGTDPSISLPVAASSSYTAIRNNVGQGYILDAGTQVYPTDVRLQSTTLLTSSVRPTSGTYQTAASITATVPMTWATGDILYMRASYEAA